MLGERAAQDAMAPAPQTRRAATQPNPNAAAATPQCTAPPGRQQPSLAGSALGAEAACAILTEGSLPLFPLFLERDRHLGKGETERQNVKGNGLGRNAWGREARISR